MGLRLVATASADDAIQPLENAAREYFFQWADSMVGYMREYVALDASEKLVHSDLAVYLGAPRRTACPALTCPTERTRPHPRASVCLERLIPGGLEVGHGGSKPWKIAFG